MNNDIDLLMDTDPLDLTSDDPRLEAIIAYHRQARANAEAGIKPKKEGSTTKTKIDLEALGLLAKKPPVVRRV